MAGTPASSRGSGLPTTGGTLTGPLDIDLAADAVGLTVTAAPGGGAHIVDFVPDNPNNAIGMDSFGRLVSKGFAFLGITATNRFAVSIPATAHFTVEDDDTGDAIIKATAGVAGDKLGFFNSAPAVQPTAVADASGGAIQDAEARTALNALLARMRTLGLIDT